MRYFAYGSNMSLQRFTLRIPCARVIGVARLAGHALQFHKLGDDGSGKCDAHRVGSAEQHVLGVVYEISPDDALELDAFEGAGYQRTSVAVQYLDGLSVSAATYLARPDVIRPGLAPYDWYLEHVKRGALYFRFPKTYFSAIKSVETQGDPDLDRARQELQMYLHL